MINPFPELLNYQLFAPTLIRLTLGIFILSFGIKKAKGDREYLTNFFESLSLRPGGMYIKTLAGAEIILGIMLIAGFLTQIAAIVIAIILIVSLIVSHRSPEVQLEKPSLYALLLVMSIALLLTGAGLIAFDLPL